MELYGGGSLGAPVPGTITCARAEKEELISSTSGAAASTGGAPAAITTAVTSSRFNIVSPDSAVATVVCEPCMDPLLSLRNLYGAVAGSQKPVWTWTDRDR